MLIITTTKMTKKHAIVSQDLKLSAFRGKEMLT